MDKVLELIVNGSDTESVINQILVERNLEPWNIDIVSLSEGLIEHLAQARFINFRIPARFILVSAVILRFKSETLLPKQEVVIHEPEKIDLDGIPSLELPVKRIPTRNITFDELMVAINKVLKGVESKEEIKARREEKLEDIKKLVELEIDNYVDRVYRELQKVRKTTYYTITKGKEPIDSAKYFVAMLHLANQQKVSVHQEVVFEDIDITVKDILEIKKEMEKVQKKGDQNNTPEILQNLQSQKEPAAESTKL